MLRSIYKPGTSANTQQRQHPLSQAVDINDVQDVQEEGQEEEADSLGSLPPMGPPRSIPSLGKARSRQDSKDDDPFSPLTAQDCFEEALEVDLEEQGTWRVHRTPPKRRPGQKTSNAAPTRTLPADTTLASLSIPSLPSDEDEDEESGAVSEGPGTMFLFHHGAGFSSLSFALTSREITRQTKGAVGVMALDCRGHGRTRHPPSTLLPLDMSLERLTADAVLVLEKLYPDGHLPTLVLVGHSMGGSVVVSLSRALQDHPWLKARIAGVVVMDVVEGTAMEALVGMRGIVERQPKGFDSVSDAIQWHVESGVIHNVHSARVSVPSLIVRNDTFDKDKDSQSPTSSSEPIEVLQDADDDPTAQPQQATNHAYTWRADLLSTEPYWPNWFTGLSQRFLTTRTARLLLLAGTDRLDKDLMVGQMQGKYQLAVFPDTGHSLQEDVPEKTAKLLVDFWKRNEVVPGKLKVGVKKVGES